MRSDKTKGQIKLEGYFAELVKKKDVIDTIKSLQAIRERNNLRDEESFIEYFSTLDALCERHNLREFPWRDIFEKLVIKGLDTEIDFTLPVYDTCYLRVFDFEENAPREDIDWLNSNYPVAVAINPYATKEEIVDYIDKNLPVIRAILDTKKAESSPIEKYKKRNKEVADRDDFIFQKYEEGLSRKEIMEIYNDSVSQEELKIYDYDTIGKIVQR
jgi:hypothetical protein